MTSKLKIVKSIYSDYVVVSSGRYAAVGGGQYYGYDPARDRHAVRQSLREIRDDLDTMYAGHDCPARWPRGADAITVTVRGY